MSALRSYGPIHAARRAIGLDEVAYRALLERETGKTSLRAMTSPELGKVLTALNAGHRHGRKPLGGPYAAKLQALWLSAWNLGIVRDRRDEAMLSFIERQTGIKRTEFLRSAKDARKAVEGLKSWMTRAALVDWSTGDHRPDYQNNPRYQVVEAQVIKLLGPKSEQRATSIYQGVSEATGMRNLNAVTDAGWIETQARLGRRIRGEV